MHNKFEEIVKESYAKMERRKKESKKKTGAVERERVLKSAIRTKEDQS